MRSWPICLLLFAVLISSLVASAQQPPVSIPKTPPPQANNNVNLPVSTENWAVPGDIKTGLDPQPPVLVTSDSQPEFVRDLFRLQWRATDPIDVWVIRPKLAGKVPEKVPVILYLYSFDDNGERFRDNDWCQRNTADGYAAVGFVSALSDYRFRNHGLSKWFVSEMQESLGSTTHDVQLILNFLASLGDIDMSRVGMFGMGSGGTIAILAAYADPRINTLDVLDPWGDWPDWVRNPTLSAEDRSKFSSAEFLDRIVALDPVVYLPTIRTRNIRIQQLLSDPITPPVAKGKISSAAPFRAILVKYQGPQDLYKSWQLSGLTGWIKQQLPSPPQNGTANEHHVARN